MTLTIVLPGSSGQSSTIVGVLERAARQCSISQPSSWVTTTRLDHVELRDDFLSETIDDILERTDLPAPIAAQFDLVGDGSETYDLPDNFKRLQRGQMAIYDSQLDRAVEPIPDDGQWTYLKDIGTAGIIHYYRLRGYDGNWQIDLYDAPTASRTISIHYITKNWMADAAGVVGSEFTAEDDNLLFPRRLVEAGIVWRCRERRGLPYQDKYNEYEIMLSRLSNDTRGRRRVNFGEPTRDVRWQDMIPAFIPPS